MRDEHPLLTVVAIAATMVENIKLKDEQRAKLRGKHPLHPIYRSGMDSGVRRATRDHGLPYEWTSEYRRWVCNTFNHQCAYCGRRNCKFHLDHIIPVSWLDSPGATVDNAVLACKSCNVDRGNQPLADWLDATFPGKTDRILKKVERIRAAAWKRWGPTERAAMRKEGKKITKRRLKAARKRAAK
jgi:5-methylcytosine-specific restriction endonuclease McrA